jgi:hypothetical protein
VIFDELADTQHQLQVGVLRGDGKDVGAKGIVLAQTPLQVLQLG